MNVKRTRINSCVPTLPWHLAHWISAAFSECLVSLLHKIDIHKVLEKYFYPNQSSKTCLIVTHNLKLLSEFKLFHSLVNYYCKRFVESWVFSHRPSILLGKEAALKSNIIPKSAGIISFLELIGFWRLRNCISFRHQDPFTL